MINYLQGSLSTHPPPALSLAHTQGFINLLKVLLLSGRLSQCPCCLPLVLLLGSQADTSLTQTGKCSPDPSLRDAPRICQFRALTQMVSTEAVGMTGRCPREGPEDIKWPSMAKDHPHRGSLRPKAGQSIQTRVPHPGPCHSPQQVPRVYVHASSCLGPLLPSNHSAPRPLELVPRTSVIF